MYSIVAVSGLFLVAIVFKYFHQRMQNSDRQKLLNRIPELPVAKFPIIGQAWVLFGSLESAFRKGEMWLNENESPFRVTLGNITAILLTKSEDIEETSKKCTHRKSYGFLEGVFPEGILSQNYDEWKRTRRLMNPAFGPYMLNQYVKVFTQQSQVLVEILKPKADTQETFDIWPYLVNASIDMITENMTGIESKCQITKGNDYSEVVIRSLQILFQRIINPFIYPRFLFFIHIWYTGKAKNLKCLQAYTTNILQRAMEKLAAKMSPNQRRESLSTPQNPPQTMIEILLNAHNTNPEVMTSEQMVNEMIHLLGAGSETTALTLGFLLLMLGKHQDIQEMVFKEIDDVLKNRAEVTMDEINRLNYLEQCIKETLRLFNIIPMTFRTTAEAIELSSKITLPEDVGVILHLNKVHDNPSYYPCPDIWNPDNFSEDAIRKRPKNSFIPFGVGPRTCLGSKYAMISIKVQASNIIRNYHVAVDHNLKIELQRDLVHRSKNGYPIRIRKRTAEAVFSH